ncbi:hypothetical protein BC938DRAFT_479276 [Jimgerdemannia flammicorona]|uniref:Uncharacterized protein n=1 Tax=Jimgerdemannia flammicorona TaxID=994334 RepID=A0A433QL60_9FUNG|nr:hypothetical protein BC938DRAFT_479276 [Jimgerdemannia flammicorona]
MNSKDYKVEAKYPVFLLQIQFAPVLAHTQRLLLRNLDKRDTKAKIQTVRRSRISIMSTGIERIGGKAVLVVLTTFMVWSRTSYRV